MTAKANIISEYQMYLSRTNILHTARYLKMASEILKMNIEKLTAEFIKQYFASQRRYQSAIRFFNFLSARGYIVQEKGVALNRMQTEPADKYFDEFLKWNIANGRADNTIITYTGALKLFKEYLESVSISGLNEISTKIVDNFKNFLYVKQYGPLNKNYCNKVQKDYFLIIKQYFQYLYDNEYINYNPAKLCKPPLSNYPIKNNYLKHDEMNELLKNIPHETPIQKRDFMIVYIGYFYGLRRNELRLLTTNDIDFNHKIIYIRNSKDRRDRNLPLIEPAETMLKLYIENIRPHLLNIQMPLRDYDKKKIAEGIPDNVLFPDMYTKGHLSKSFLQQIFHKAMNNAFQNMQKSLTDKEKEKLQQKKLTMHSLRYSFATNMLETGISIRYIQRAMGHNTIESTGMYTRVTTDDLGRILKAFHPRERNSKKYMKEAHVKNGDWESLYADKKSESADGKFLSDKKPAEIFRS